MSTSTARAFRYVCRQCHQRQRHPFTTSSALRNEATAASRLVPRVAKPSFWSSLVPRFLRKPITEEEAAERARVRDVGAEERRTGIIFLILGLVVGSNAINILAIRREMLNFTRQTDAKLELLREVVQKVKNGEDVDVKRALGTGDPAQEKEWEEVMRELEETDMLEEGRKKRLVQRAAKEEQTRLKTETRREAYAAEKAATAEAEAQDNSRPKFLM